MEYSWALLIQVGRKNGWRMSASFRETMKGHVEADERVEALHHEADSDTEEGMEFRVTRIKLQATLSVLTFQATALTRLKANDPDKLRRMTINLA